MTKWVYRFGNGAAEGRADMKNLLGGKGAGLAEMSNLGLPVPPGLTITTEVCTYFYGHGKSYPPELREQVADGLAALDHSVGARFGVAEQLGHPFPQEPEEQLWGAIGAVFGSWMNSRAMIYRRLHDIPADWGTAVNVQAMVFGNMGTDCATGVAFTCNPSTGTNELYGEYLVNAQGEDVVAGIRTPQHLTVAGKQASQSALPAMEE